MFTTSCQRIKYIVGDFLAVSLAWFVFNVVRYVNVVVPYEGFYSSFWDFLGVKPVVLGQVCFPLMMVALYALGGYYNYVLLKSRVQDVVTTIAWTALGTVIIFFVAIVNDPIPDRASNLSLLFLLFGLMTVLVVSSRLIVSSSTTRRLRRHQWHFNCIAVGTPQDVSVLKRRLESTHHPFGMKIVGMVNPDKEAQADEKTKDGLPIYSWVKLPEIVKEQKIQNLIVEQGKRSLHSTMEIINRLFPLDLPILISPSVLNLLAVKPRLNNVIGEPLVDITHASISPSTVNLKRVGDIFFSLIALIGLSPLLAVVAIAVKCDSKGPVFYRQERVGYKKRPFKIVKFRTMGLDAEKNGPALSSEGDPRITRVGRFLRKYRIDEIPQFWNVLRGDMSIVGPRPERAFYINQILKRAPYYTIIHQVRPGITSLGMVRHGYASTVEQMVRRLQYDILYLENISFLVDLKILFYTFSTVLHGRGL